MLGPSSELLASVSFTVESFLLTGQAASPSPFFPITQDGFKDCTTFQWTQNALAKRATVRVYNQSNVQVRHVVFDRGTSIGGHAWNWCGRRDDGRVVQPGTFHIRVTATNQWGILKASPFAWVRAAAGSPLHVRIHEIYYNAPGSDTGGNLNGEWNANAVGWDISGWTIKDAVGHTYRFGSYTLGAHRYVKVHTGHGSSTPTDRYWGSGWYIWNNDRDTGYLHSWSGRLIDSCFYNSVYASRTYC